VASKTGGRREEEKTFIRRKIEGGKGRRRALAPKKGKKKKKKRKKVDGTKGRAPSGRKEGRVSPLPTRRFLPRSRQEKKIASGGDKGRKILRSRAGGEAASSGLKEGGKKKGGNNWRLFKETFGGWGGKKENSLGTPEESVAVIRLRKKKGKKRKSKGKDLRRVLGGRKKKRGA